MLKQYLNMEEQGHEVVQSPYLTELTAELQKLNNAEFAHATRLVAEGKKWLTWLEHFSIYSKNITLFPIYVVITFLNPVIHHTSFV